MRSRPGLVPALVVGILATGCIPFLTGGPDCINEHRGVDVRSALDDGSSVGVALWEERNASSKRTALQRVYWWAQPTRPRGEITELHVHEGPLAGGGRVLLALDPRDPQPSAPTMIVVGPYEYFGPVPWNDVYSALLRGEVYVDMHVTPQHPGFAHGAITVENPGHTGWVHSYCS